MEKMPKDPSRSSNRGVNLITLKEGVALLFRFNGYIARYWREEVYLAILGGFSILLGLSVPYLGKIILDKGILAKDAGLFIRLTILTGGVYLLRLAIDNASGFLKSYVTRKVRIDLSTSVLKRIRKFSLRSLQARSTGEYIFRINSDINSSANIIATTFPGLLGVFVKIICVTAVILTISWKMLVLVLICQWLALFRMRLFAKETEELMRRSIANSQKAFKVLNELFSHVYFLKASGTLAFMVRRYFHALVQNVRLEVKNARLGFVSRNLSSVSGKLFFGMVTVFGSFLIIKGDLTLGSLSAVMLYFSQGTAAYESVLNLGQQIVLNRVLLERTAELLDADIEVREKVGAKDVDLSNGVIEFRDVSFGYEKSKYVIDGMSFIIPARSKLALVGNSGCGKTTILNLLLRLYDVDRGVVLLAGCDARNLRFRSIYRQIGIVPQAPYLWNDTIAYNIAYENSKIDKKDIIRAAELAEARYFIEDFPRGFDTVAGEMGCLISRGQEQRLAIARAIAKRPRILILDEAFSSLDSETEEKIIENIKDAFRDSTIIIVSHRLSTVKKMDMVYFLESSGTMTVASHEWFVENNSRYRELFAGQIEESQLIGEACV